MNQLDNIEPPKPKPWPYLQQWHPDIKLVIQAKLSFNHKGAYIATFTSPIQPGYFQIIGFRPWTLEILKETLKILCR